MGFLFVLSSSGPNGLKSRGVAAGEPGFAAPVVRDVPFAGSVFGLVVLLAAAMLLPLPLIAGPQQAERILHNKRLVAFEGGSVWVSDAELELRENLASLPRIRRSLRALEQRLDERVAASLGPGPGGSSLVASAAPEQLGNVPDVRRDLIRLSTARCQLALSVFAIRSAASRMLTRYEQLGRDPEVQAALQSLGAGHRLGPLRDYGSDLRRLRGQQQSVLTDWAPLYRQGPHLRFAGILNERLPVTFSWSEDLPLVLTHSVAEAAGLELDSRQRGQVLELDGRPLAVPPARVAYLQFGSCVLRGVTALILPPEGEDLGCRIGPAAFAGYQVRLRPERLRVTFEEKPGC